MNNQHSATMPRRNKSSKGSKSAVRKRPTQVLKLTDPEDEVHKQSILNLLDEELRTLRGRPGERCEGG